MDRRFAGVIVALGCIGVGVAIFGLGFTTGRVFEAWCRIGRNQLKSDQTSILTPQTSTGSQTFVYIIKDKD